MKTLLLFRHGKSDWNADNGVDHDRPLNERGARAAKTMGRFLKQADQKPDSIVTSSAVRARTTAELAAQAGKWGSSVRVTRALYEATPFVVLEEVRAEPDTTAALLLAGHEPTTSELLGLLIGGGAARIPTAAMARIDFEVESWKDVAFGRGALVWLVPPKLFTQGKFEFVE